ncbi:MAG TPA: hypothetical protein VMB18_16820 [Terriglobales bacterium]|nr:hypothetical protein [Terriglobales bacterium]
MNRAYVLYEMGKADFLERVRRYSFLLTLAGALYLGYSVATEKMWVVIGNRYRGVYNSAWIGAIMAVSCSAFLSLIGFYVVKNSVQRDTETRVGQILAATPMRKSFYALAKTLSNFAVLAFMVVVLMFAALAMQLLHAENRELSIGKLCSPFLLIALPAMAVTSAIAVLFEMLPLLNGGFGNVAYFFVWSSGLAVSAQIKASDPTGIQLLFRSAGAALSKIDPSHQNSFSLTIGGQRAVRTFVWDGFDWTASMVAGRLMWVLIAIGIALLASLFFHRFDPAREFWRKKKADVSVKSPAGETESTNQNARETRPAQLTPLAGRAAKLRFFQIATSELRLMLKGQRWWWYAGAAGILIGSLVSPLTDSRGGWLVAAWIWPVLIWSQMGSRENRYTTQALIFSCERALQRQLPAVWAAGVILSTLTGAGVGVRLLIAADWQGVLAWLAGALFIPSLALAMGVWSGGSKAFEALYTVWWYVGPLHHVPGIDFAGTTAASSNAAAYMLVTTALLATAYVGRRTRLGYA